MRNDIILKLQRIIEGNDRITWDLFPAIYDGFLEAGELSLAEDRMLQFVASTVQRCSNDKIVSTATEEKIAEWELELGLSSDGLTLEQRRQQVVDYINRSRVFNETTLHELCQLLAGDSTVYERLDVNYLTLGIFTEEEEGEPLSVGIVDQIRPIVPQNLALYAGIDTSFDRGVTISHAHFSALKSGLGIVEWHEPPIPPPPENKPDFAVLDNETGEVVHTSGVAHTGFISFTQMYKVAPIAHTGFKLFTELYRLPNDTVRFIDFPPPEAIIGYMWHDSTVTFSVGGYLYIYDSDGTTPRYGESGKTYTIVHVLTAPGVYADEYLSQLYITMDWSGLFELRARTGTYETLTFWRIEYIEE